MRVLAAWIVLLVIIPAALLMSVLGIYPYEDAAVYVCEEAAGIDDGSWDGLTTRGLREAPGILCDFDLNDGTKAVVHATSWSWWVIHLLVIVAGIAFALRTLRSLPFYVLTSIGATIYGLFVLCLFHGSIMFTTMLFVVALAGGALLTRWLVELRKRLNLLNP